MHNDGELEPLYTDSTSRFQTIKYPLALLYNMAFTCAVLGCSNSSRKLTKWKVTMCGIQHVRRDSEICTCKKRKAKTDFKLLSVS